MGERDKSVGAAVIAAVALPFVLVPVALAKPAPKLIGNPGLGVTVFTATCASCHYAGIAPNLDHLTLTEKQIIALVSSGGGGGAAAASYGTTMPAFKGVLTAAQINNVSAYVYKLSHHTP